MPPPRRIRPAGSRSGLSLIELLVVFTVLGVALSFMARAFGNVGKLAPTNRETVAATLAVQNVLEEMRATAFPELFASFNEDPSDDPGGAGTAPGRGFQVAGLSPQRDDPDGMVGAIDFPTLGAELREDVVNRDLGLPRDLDGDGTIDAADHSGDYEILPVTLRVEWRTDTGHSRSLRLHSTLSRP